MDGSLERLVNSFDPPIETSTPLSELNRFWSSEIRSNLLELTHYGKVKMRTNSRSILLPAKREKDQLKWNQLD